MNKIIIFMTKLEELVHLCSRRSSLPLINVNLFLIFASSFLLIACSANANSKTITDIDAFDVKNTEGVTGIRYEDAGADWIKSINYEGQIIKFEDGKCTNWNELIEGELSIDYGKDSISIYSEDLPSTLTFCFINGKIAIASCENSYGGEELTFNYSHEDETLLESITIKSYDYDRFNGGVDTHSVITSVEITKTDDHGNWIERKFNSTNEEWIEKRVIYYEKKADSISNDEAEQLELAQKEWDEFTSSDLKTFFVKGHVKEIVYGTDYTTTIRFSEEGKLTYHSSYQNSEYKHQYKRNSKGQLTDLLLKDSWDGGDEGETYKYNADGYPCFYSNWSSDTVEKSYTQYDENHWPTSGEGYEGGAPITFTYPSVDDHGNWTTQKANVHFSKIFDGVEDETYTEKRTIKYYEFHK